ncbi:hypothetical protein [Streptomyces sp. NPDC057616]|uniref:hypothetical protein n=1 Tax=Streptomyces sp. NPDC057616 TaxID=3346183 RepID=UPI0036A8FD59
MTGQRLRARVASVAATLRDLGFGQSDRVLGVPAQHTRHAVIAFLAAASLGAVGSECRHEYAPWPPPTGSPSSGPPSLSPPTATSSTAPPTTVVTPHSNSPARCLC